MDKARRYYSLYFDLRQKEIRIKLLKPSDGLWRNRELAPLEGCYQWNSCYYLSSCKADLKTMALQIKTEWLKPLFEQIEDINRIDIKS